MWIFSLIATVISLAAYFEFFKRSVNRLQRISLSVRNISYNIVLTPQNLPPYIVIVSVMIRVLILNDGNRASFIDKLETRLDPVSDSDYRSYFESQAFALATPYQFSLKEVSSIVDWERHYVDNVDTTPSFPIILKADDFAFVDISGNLCFENRTGRGTLSLPGKLSLHVVYVDINGRRASKSLFGGMICLYDNARLHKSLPHDDFQIIMEDTTVTRFKNYFKRVRIFAIPQFIRKLHGLFLKNIQRH